MLRTVDVALEAGHMMISEQQTGENQEAKRSRVSIEQDSGESNVTHNSSSSGRLSLLKSLLPTEIDVGIWRPSEVSRWRGPS